MYVTKYAALPNKDSDIVFRELFSTYAEARHQASTTGGVVLSLTFKLCEKTLLADDYIERCQCSRPLNDHQTKRGEWIDCFPY